MSDRGIIADGLDYLKNLVVSGEEVKTFKHEGQTFGNKEPVRIVAEAFAPSCMKMTTLQGLVDHLSANRDELDLSKMVIVVENPNLVVMYGGMEGERRERFGYAKVERKQDDFNFDTFMDVESFHIKVMTSFVPDENRAALLEAVAGVKFENSDELELEDDGNSQSANMRRGKSLKGKQTIKNPVMLRAHRTFTEVSQVESPYIFRLTEEGSEIKLALFECDNGEWKRRTLENIKDWLEKFVSEIPVLA